MAIGEEKKSGTWWKVLLGVLGGFFLGIGATVGGVAIAGSVVKTGTLLGGNADKYLSKSWQDKTILNIVMDAVNGRIKVETLGDLNDITPTVGDYVTNVKNSLNGIGTELTNEDMYKWKIETLADDIIGAVKGAKLIRVLSHENIDYPDPIIKYLSYETYPEGTEFEGEYVYDAEGNLVHCYLKDILDDPHFIQYKVDTMKIKMLFKQSEIDDNPLLKSLADKSVKDLSKKGAFNNIKLSDVVEVTASSPQILKTFKEKGTTVGELNTTINDLKLSDVIEINDSSSQILKTFKEKGTTINGMNDAINDLKLSEVIEINDSSSQILKTFKEKGTKVTEMNAAINELKISEVIEINDSSSQILKTFKEKGTTVNGMNEAINDLQLQDVLELHEGDLLYRVREDKITELNDIDSKLTVSDVFPDRSGMKFIKYLDADTPINQIGTKVNQIKLVEAFEDNIFEGTESTSPINKTWKYMLAETPAELASMGSLTRGSNEGKPFATFACNAYTVGGSGAGADKGIDGLVTNMTNNMKSATIRQLDNDKIVEFGNTFVEGAINPLFIATGQVPTGATTYGDLTLEELTNIITHLA